MPDIFHQATKIPDIEVNMPDVVPKVIDLSGLGPKKVYNITLPQVRKVQGGGHDGRRRMTLGPGWCGLRIVAQDSVEPEWAEHQEGVQHHNATGLRVYGLRPVA
jgi:hypothetical protein